MKKFQPEFTIIISLYVITDRFFVDLKKFHQLIGATYEIIVVTEKNFRQSKFDGADRVLRSPKTLMSLSEKRNIGIRVAHGAYCAFIDDDAYPDKNWLKRAKELFASHPDIGAVGGPNLTPAEDGFWAHIGGYIYESYVTSGAQQSRFLPTTRKEVPELQGVNLLIRTEVLRRVGGFTHSLNSGDDSTVCQEIHRLGYSILYDPEVRVFHHRRPFPRAHLLQIRNMATHRGFFVKKYPETLAPLYFLPSVLTLGCIGGGCAALFSATLRQLFLVVLGLFFLLGFFSSWRRAGVVQACLVSIGIIFTHLTYGVFFLKGLFIISSLERGR